MTIDGYKEAKLPDEPGVYRFIDESGVILYIGRATSLRDRVRSYFGKDLIDERGPAFIDMVTRSHHIEWTETKSVLEAVILEANLIKKFQPYYNTKEKDNKSHYFVVITDEDYPRVFLERGRVLEQLTDTTSKIPILRTFGPFPSGPAIRETLRLLRKIFPFRSGKTNNPSRDRFYESLGLAAGIDTGRAEYRQMIDDLSKLLEGKQSDVLHDLEERMMQYARAEKFEQAAQVRNTIWSLNHIRDVTLIKTDRSARDVASVRIEAYDVAHLEGSSMVGVMVVLENGEPQKSEYRKFHIRGITSSNDPAALTQILVRRLRHREWRMPNIMVCDGNEVQMNIGQAAASGGRLDASVVSVVKDEHHRPRDILGDPRIIATWRDAILLANSEAHRYALEFHKVTRSKKFLGK